MPELRGFLALIINMGIIQVPEIEDYWKTGRVSEIPFFRTIMPRDRFEQIFWMLHVSHSTSQHPKKIDKVKIFLDLLIPKFQSSYYPSQNIAVDETMVGFRGRFGARQYMPQKPTKWGIKAFTMADSTNGYLLNILVYTGAETLADSPTDESLPQPARVVVHLMEPYLDKGHHVFIDRYYNSIPLVRALEIRGTVVTGTCNKNRVGLPDSIRKPRKFSDNEVFAFRDGTLLCLAWRAPKKKTPVIMLSSEASARLVTTPRKRHRQQVQKPAVVDLYNHNMNGVDVADQLTVFYPFTRKTLKWWRKLFFWLVEVTLVNSYLLYKQVCSEPRSHLAYRRAIVESLAASHIASVPRPRPSRPRTSTPINGDPERMNGRLHLLGKRPNTRALVLLESSTWHRSR